MNLLEEIKKTANGAVILREWLGDGGMPIPREKALERARTCAPCPQNVRGKWWEGTRHAVAKAIREHLEVKHRLNLEVPEEEAIQTCGICKCNLPLAIWTPIEHIQNNTSQKEIDDFKARAPWCWKLKEFKL